MGKALVEEGAIVDYTDISEELVEIFINDFRKSFAANYIDLPERSKEYDWTFSFEPLGAKSGLILALVRALTNRKGAIFVIFPRIKDGKPVGGKEKSFPILFEKIHEIYDVEISIKDVNINSTRGSGKEVKSKHRIFTVITNEKAQKMVEEDILLIFKGKNNARTLKISELINPELLTEK